MSTLQNRLRRGVLRWWRPEAPDQAERLRRLEVGFLLFCLTRTMFGPTHEGSMHAAETGLMGYFVTAFAGWLAMAGRKTAVKQGESGDGGH